MITEFEIMLDIYTEVNNNIEQLKASRQRFVEIHKAIDLLDNNYFETKYTDEIFKQYLNVYNDDNETFNELLSNLDMLKINIQDKIKNMCNHEWINDTIDINPDRSQNICYCVKCEVTRK